VTLEDRYADRRSVLRRVRQADVVLLPYRSREQVVSGVLVEALASGKPVVATRFPHAVELLCTETAAQ
jgi:polysaccharide biosynthesis protein PslF